MNDEQWADSLMTSILRGWFPDAAPEVGKWRSVVELAESRDAKAICLALGLLAATVRTPAPGWETFDLDRPPKGKPE